MFVVGPSKSFFNRDFIIIAWQSRMIGFHVHLVQGDPDVCKIIKNGNRFLRCMRQVHITCGTSM